MSRLYISQRRLDEWVEQERVSLEETQMTLANGKRFLLIPAVHFVEVVGTDQDPNQLLGTVKTQQQLLVMSAEHYRDSVIVGDVGYQVLEGFVGEPLD